MNVGNALSDLIYGNPFTTEVGALIEEATDGLAVDELWQLFSGVCRAINLSLSGPKDAIRAIRRRLLDSAQSNETVAFHSLLLLETCMLNCNHRFHVVVATRNNLKDFAKIATNDLVPDRLRRKLLFLFQSWALNLGNHVDLREFSTIYTELKSQGIQFPESAQFLEGRSGVFATNNVEKQSTTSESTAPIPESVQSSSAHAQLQETRDTKLSKDLAQVRENIYVLNDLITDSETYGEHVNQEAKSLMADVADSLNHMSQRLSEAISVWETYQETLPERSGKDSVMLTMLDVNDELHAVLSRYAETLQTNNPESSHTNSGDMAAILPSQPARNIDSFVGEASHSSRTAVPPVCSENGSDNVILQPPSGVPKHGSTEDDDLIVL